MLLYVPSLDHHGSYRINDGSSVVAAEMEAIQKAIEWAINANLYIVLLFFQTLRAIQSREQHWSVTPPQQLEDLMIALDDYGKRAQSPAIIVWISGHLGIAANEVEDVVRPGMHYI